MLIPMRILVIIFNTDDLSTFICIISCFDLLVLTLCTCFSVIEFADVFCIIFTLASGTYPL